MPALPPLLAGAVLVLASVLEPAAVDGPDTIASANDVVRVSGALTFTTTGSGAVGTFSDHALEWRGTAVRGHLRTNDARLTGDLRLYWNCDVFLPDYVNETNGGVATGSVVITKREGTWEGVWRGLTFPEKDGGHHQLLLTGAGAYERYSALLYLRVVEGELLVDGLVFPGKMPPVPAPPG